MKIILNQRLYTDKKAVYNDPALVKATEYWGKEGVIEKSAIDIRIFDTPFNTISILYGPRQIGKTASLKLYLSQLEDSDTVICTDCSVILNKNDLYHHLFDLIEGRTTIVLDEVQAVEDWTHALRTLYSDGKLVNCRVWCTGSEARYLLESGERLPGRKGNGLVVFARPWSFREYMDFFYSDLIAPYKTINFHHVNQNWLNAQTVDWQIPWTEYCLTGGFPQIIAEYRTRKNIPDQLWQVYIDWVLGSWSKLRTSDISLRAVARRLIETINCRVSMEAIKQGTDIQSANTIKTLIDIQEDHFAIYSLPRMDIQTLDYLPAKLKKLYPLDPFLAHVWQLIGSDTRRLFAESVVSLQLDECAFQTQTYRTLDKLPVAYLYSPIHKTEIDFYFDNCAFELKSNGSPSRKQWEMLNQCPQAFVVNKSQLPLMAYLVGEGRMV